MSIAMTPTLKTTDNFDVVDTTPVADDVAYLRTVMANLYFIRRCRRR